MSQNAVSGRKRVDPGTDVIMDKEKTHYKMDHKKRGVALIFNHNKYENPELNERNGTDADCDFITKVMEKLGFDVVVCNDFTANQIMKELQDTSAMDHTDNDCLAIFVLTHGTNNHLSAYDSEYHRDKLWLPFTGKVCKSLAGKPKLFFIQACRSAVDEDEKDSVMDTPPSEENIVNIPQVANFLAFNSCVDGFVAFRNSTNGSWFIQTLCNVLDEKAYEDDLLSLYTIVNKRVAIEYKKKNGLDGAVEKQMPIFTSQLLFKLQFTPPKTPGTSKVSKPHQKLPTL